VVEERRIVRGFVPGAILGFVALIGAIQFIRPARTNPPVIAARTLEAAIAVPSDVQTVLSRACQDCHSNLTRWPWYSALAPISWFVVDHVNDGRRDFNFSEWLRPDVKDPRKYTSEKLHTACREMRLGHMPLYSYVLLHPEGRVNSQDIETICGWVETRVSPP
jgi:hypothetical protein